MPTKQINKYYIYLDDGSKVIRIKSIKLSDNSIIIYAGNTKKLTFKVYPYNAGYTELTWTSKNPDIADVNEDGVVTGKRHGVTTVTLTINNVEVSCKVTVLEIIKFKDPKVKKICVRNWDKDKDGEISLTEAATIKEIPLPMFTGTPIESFDELAYFSNLKTIGMHAFDSCSYLSSITFPESLETIGKNAFSNCSSLNNIMISSGVKEIKSYAFSNCDSLISVYVNNMVPPTAGNNILDDCNNLVAIEVPDEYKQIYCDTVGWGIDSNNNMLYYTYIIPYGFDYEFNFFLS